MSVKCVLLTDKSIKIGALSVNPDEILAELVERHGISFNSNVKLDFFPGFFLELDSAF